MQAVLEFFTASGSLALVALAIFLLSGAQRLVCASSIRSYMCGGTPLEWFGNGFLNTVISCDTNATSSTIFGYSYSKMLSQNGVLYSLLGVFVAPVTFVILVFAITNIGNFYLYFIPILGLGYLVSLISYKTKSFSRIVMALGLLAFALFMASRSIGSILATYVYSGELFYFTSYGVWALLLGIGVGIVGSVVFRSPYIMSAIGVILLSQNGFGQGVVLGIFIGAFCGVLFVLAPMAARAGTVVMRAFMQFSMAFMIAIILFCIAYPFLPNLLNLSRDPSTGLFLFTLFLLAFLPLGTYLSSLLSRVIIFFIPNSPKEGSHLVMLSKAHRPDATLSLLQVQQEIVNHTRRTYKMLSFLRDILNEEVKRGEKVEALYERIAKYKVITDRVETEIVGYICSVALGDISRQNTLQMQQAIISMGKVNQIADDILNVSNLIRLGFNDRNEWDEQQLEVIALSVHKLQQLQYAVISAMEANIKNIETVDNLSAELVDMIDQSNKNFYLYNQVLMIETLGGIKSIAKLLCNLTR